MDNQPERKATANEIMQAITANAKAISENSKAIAQLRSELREVRSLVQGNAINQRQATLDEGGAVHLRSGEVFLPGTGILGTRPLSDIAQKAVDEADRLRELEEQP